LRVFVPIVWWLLAFLCDIISTEFLAAASPLEPYLDQSLDHRFKVLYRSKHKRIDAHGTLYLVSELRLLSRSHIERTGSFHFVSHNCWKLS
jgi:hypothetical protein